MSFPVAELISIQWELVDEIPITKCNPSTLCRILDHHQECVYCKSNVTFACTLLLCKCLLFILVLVCIYTVSLMSNSSDLVSFHDG